TIVRLLEGALQPTAGAVLLGDIASTEQAFVAARRRVGIVPQSPGMYDDLLLREYLELVRRLYGCADALRTVEPMGLAPYLDRPLAALSGGLQRRAVLAAALLPEPEVLILDEPTAGLDPVAARDVRQTLHQAMAGRTVLLCTHNLAEAEQLCDSVIILRAGQVALHERIDRLRSRLTPRVRLEASQGPAALAAALRLLEHIAPPETPLSRRSNGIEFPLSEPERFLPSLLRALLSRGVDVYEARILRPTLEDLFFDILEATASTDDAPHGRDRLTSPPAPVAEPT
ncbi:MAG: ABC transporter ATP-binding protein, partial [Chloroflexota bacterium]